MRLLGFRIKIPRRESAGNEVVPAESLLGAHGQDGGAEASHLRCCFGKAGCRTEVECAVMEARREGRWGKDGFGDEKNRLVR